MNDIINTTLMSETVPEVAGDNPVIILGGTSFCGRYLVRQMAEANRTATLVVRRPVDVPPDFTVLRHDLDHPEGLAIPKGAVIVSLLPLLMLVRLLPHLTNASAVIATGTTSRFSKAGSSDAHERLVAEQLEGAEVALQNWAEQHGVRWTVVRPTLIYDGTTDKNIARMARFIRRWHFLPIARPSKGLRQPIHADDVAKALLKCIDNPAAANKALNIAGSEVMTYRDMAERVFLALGRKPRLVMLPVPFLRLAFRVASLLGLVRERDFGVAIFQRMNEDLVFDVADGLKALDYQPRRFDLSKLTAA